MENINYSISIKAIRKQANTNELSQVDWTITATQAAHEISVDYTTNVTPENKEALGIETELTEQKVVSWIEATDERLPGVKNHLQMQLNNLVAKDELTPVALSWVN
jgi:hypothetical protein